MHVLDRVDVPWPEELYLLLFGSNVQYNFSPLGAFIHEGQI